MIRSTNPMFPQLRIAFDTEETGGGGSSENKPDPDGDKTGDEGGSNGDGGGAEDKKDREDELPEWARKELSSARNEAAKYRTRLREAEQKLSDAKTPDEFEAATKDLREANAKLERELLVTKVAKDFDLPDEIASRLVGTDEAALRADAEVLKNLVVHNRPGGGKKVDPPKDLKGGLDPSEKDNTPDDPAELRKLVRRRY